MMIAHQQQQQHHHPSQQRQPPQPLIDATGQLGHESSNKHQHLHQQQSRVMQQPADPSYYQQQQHQEPQHGYGAGHEPLPGPNQQPLQYHDHMQLPAGGQFAPQQQHLHPQQQQQQQQQQQHPQQQQHQQRPHQARQYHAEGGPFANQQHHHRASPQQQQQVPPPQAPYPMQPDTYAPAPPKQQLIEQRRRLSPGYQQAARPHLVATSRHQVAGPAPVALDPSAAGQQYHQQQPAQQAGKPLKPIDQIPASAQYQQQQQQTYAPFADEQYQSSSPTLLQQQLNRTGNQPRMAPFNGGHQLGQQQAQLHQAAGGYVQQQQQPQVRGAPPGSRFNERLINDTGYGPAGVPLGPQPSEAGQHAQQVYHFQPQPQRGQPQLQAQHPHQPQHHPQHHQQHHQQHQPQHQPQVRQRAPHLEQPMPPAPHLLVGNPTPPLTPTLHCGGPSGQQQARLQAAPPAAMAGQPPISDQWLPPSHLHSGGPQHVQPQQAACRQQQQQQQQRQVPMMPKSSPMAAANNFQPAGQKHHYHHQASQPHPAIGPPSVVQHYPAPAAQSHHQPPSRPVLVHQDHHNHHHQQQQQQQQQQVQAVTPPHPLASPSMASRLTLPLRDTPLMGPFKLDHDAQVTSKVFHLKPQLFDSLSKSAMMNPAQATVIQELQFRAYSLVGPTSKSAHHRHCAALGNNTGSSDQSLLAPNSNRQPKINCHWPDLFQLTINQQLVHLDRTKPVHRAVDVFQYCQPGDNVMEIQVNDCYCTHEFVLEAVDRPTLKAFMNSCFKSRLLSYENCIQKLRFNFGSPGFLMPPQQQANQGIINEYISEQQPQGIEQTKVRISMRCPLVNGRMRTPARGHNCKHLQCFDLESFLLVNRDRSQWHCPICYLGIPFNMLELDQHQMNIMRALADNPTTDDILMDSSGQWQTYFAPQSSIMQPQQHHHLPQQQPQTAKSTGIYHPQAQSNHQHQQHAVSPSSGGNLAAGQPVPSPVQPLPRPMSGPNMAPIRQQQQQQQQPQHPGMRTNSPNTWDKPKHHQHIEPIRRPASANLGQQQQQQMCDRGSPIDLPPTKRVCTGQPASQQPYSPVGKPIDRQQQQQQYFNGPDGAMTHQSPMRTTFAPENTDDLSPLAAMERTIIQHEMGPPPFDPNSLTSMAPNGAAKGPAPTAASSAGQVGSNSPQTVLPAGSVAAAPVSHQQQADAAIIASSPVGRANSLAAASPQHQHTPSRASIGPDSPMQYANTQVTGSISHPATPVSSSMLAHVGPETPATPSNSGCSQLMQQQQQQQPLASGHSPHVGGQQPASNLAVVDHQPLSNGSASAGSITSSSTMTPSGQSLGSVGMGGDSRCGTAPLQMNGSLGLDDLMVPGGSQMANCGQRADGGPQFKVHSHLGAGSSASMDEKNEILLGKLMMDSGESLLHRSGGHHDGGELALALEEAEWKQQLDRGKSEHLANFLNEPMMNKQLNSGQSQRHQQHQQQHPGANKMLSGGINPSDDESSHASSPNQHPDQVNDFNNYLDCDAVDNGTGLPPDDSILDLFER